MATTVPYGQLAGNVNQFMTGQAMAPYLANLPNFATNMGKRSENTTAMLEGDLPQDVIQQIAQQAAERGIAGGAPSSPNSGAAYLRALGLNSLQMQQQGAQQFSQEIADTPVPELWNPMAMHVPMIMGQQEEQAANRGMMFANQQNQAQLRSQPRKKTLDDLKMYSFWNSGGGF